MAFSFTPPFVFFRNSGAHSYDPVPLPDEETLLDSPNGKETRITRSPKPTFFDPSFLLTVLAAISIAITIRNLLVIQQDLQEPYVNYLEAPIARPYNGLETLPRNESSPSWPLSSIHYPDFIGAMEGSLVHQALNNGSVVRLDSEVCVCTVPKFRSPHPYPPITPQRTIILQHRVRDYGLEQCAIKVEFSPRPRKQHERAYGSIGESPYFTLWRIVDESESKAVLTSSTLPKSLPTGKEFLGNITLDQMHPTQSPFFGCSAGSVQTLEIAMACASDPCVMEFRLARSPQRQGTPSPYRLITVNMISNKNVIAGLWVVQSEAKTTST